MNLGTARIVVIVALVVAGAVVLANGFPESSGSVAGPSASLTPSGTATSPGGTGSPTGQTTTPGPSPETTGVIFMALNGTETTGAGAAAQDLLTQDGYQAAAAAADAPSKGVAKTTVYYRGGSDAAQNKSNAKYVADSYFGKASVKKLDASLQDVVPASATFVVVVGQDYADSLAP